MEFLMHQFIFIKLHCHVKWKWKPSPWGCFFVYFLTAPVNAPTLPRELFCQLAQAAEAVCSKLAEDAGKHLCQLFGLTVASDGEGVGR